MKGLLGLATLITLIDQASKWWITQFFTYAQSQEIIPGFFHLTLVFNTGGAFGLFSQKTSFFIILSIVTILFLLGLYRSYAKKTPAIVWPVGLVLGGALGNLIDRIRLGYVVDFLDFFVGEFHWPAFNVADSCICIGLGFLALLFAKEK